MTAEMLPRIFALFAQVDGAAERSQGGLGVGLALARQLAVLHGGSIEAASAGPGQGAVFTLRLPLAASVAPDLAVSGIGAQACAAGDQVRVLIVDDNADAAETLAMLLDQLGHVTRVVTDSRQAQAAAIDFSPEVAFLDLGMPYLNGFDLARQFGSTAELERVRLAALSGWGTDEDRARSREAGIDAHLTKPVVLEDVVALLSQAARTPVVH